MPFRLLDGISFVYSDMGGGKSLYGVWRSILFHALGRQVYSNSKSLKIPHIHVDIEELLDEAENPHWDLDAKKYFFLDEVKTIVDGYSPPTSALIRKMRILFTQFRKRHIICDYMDQLETGPSYFLRRLTNYIVTAEAFRYFGQEEPYKIVYRYIRINRTVMLSTNRSRGGWIWTHDSFKHLYPYYNTYEIIEAPA